MKRLLLMIGTGMFFSLMAQQEIMPTAPRGYIMSGATLQMWRQEIIIQEPILQTSFPVHMVIPLNSRFNINFDYAYGRSDWSQSSLSGSSDAYIQANWMLWDNKLILMSGLGTPVGRTKLNSNEFELSTYLTLNIFRFRMPVYGQGLHWKIGSIVAYPVSEKLVIGVGATYLYRRKFIPLYDTNWAGQGNTIDGYYSPGNEVNTHLGIDYSLTDAMKIMLDGIYTFYEKDRYNEQVMFQSGSKLTINGGLFYRYDDQYLWLLFNYRSKNPNSARQALSFEKEALNTNRPELDMSVIWKAFVVQGGGVYVLTDGRFYGENEAGYSWARTLGGGFGGDYRLTYTTSIEFYVKYMVGQRMSLDKQKWNLEGMDTAITFRYEF